MGNGNTSVLHFAPFFGRFHDFIGFRLTGMVADFLSAREVQGLVIFGEERLFDFFLLALLNNAFFDQLIGVNLIDIFEGVDFLVHQRLCEGRLVEFIVSQTTETDDIDHDIFFEFLSIFDGQTGDFVHHFGVIGVHVENRRTDGFGDFCAIQTASGVSLRGGETHLIVGDDMNHASRGVVFKVLNLVGFIDHTLTRMGCISVNNNTHIFFTGMVRFQILNGSRLSVNQSIDRFQMRRIRKNTKTEFFPIIRCDVTRDAQMVFDVS